MSEISARPRAGLGLLIVMLAGCGSADEVTEPAPRQGIPLHPDWNVEVALEATVKLGGCVVADVDARLDGNEIVAVSSNGDVWLLSRSTDGWSQQIVVQLPGEAIQCAAGDLLPELPGDEVVVVGMLEGGEDDGGEGAVHLVSRDGDRWRSELLFRDGELVHAVTVGDLDVQRDGLEIAVAGFSRRAHLLVSGAGGDWRVGATAALPGPGKSVTSVGDRVFVACADGSLVALTMDSGATWAPTTYGSFPAGLARLGAGRDGRLVVARDDGALTLVTGRDQNAVIYKSSDKLRGAALVELDSRAPGEEAATGGYDRRVVVVYPPGPGAVDGTPRTVTVCEDRDRLHHLTSGVLPGGAGNASLVTCGYSGRVLVVTTVDA